MKCIWEVHNPKEDLKSSARSPTTTLFSMYEKMYLGFWKSSHRLAAGRDVLNAGREQRSKVLSENMRHSFSFLDSPDSIQEILFRRIGD